MTAQQAGWHDSVPPDESVEERAARLGITPERVLQEYARIAFSKITDIVTWDDKGVLKPQTDVEDDVVAAIAEVVASASSRTIYRIKMHDKKPVLDALARHLGMLPKLKSGPHDEDEPEDEDPREFLIREVDRLAAEMEKGLPPPRAK